MLCVGARVRSALLLNRAVGGVISIVETFTARDGLRLLQRSWTPDGAPRAVVGLLHGGAEHSGRYGHTAERLTASGFALDAFDQRSHGGSERVHGVPLQIEHFDDLLDDTELWLASRRQVHGDRPLFVLGHSMGALIAIALASRGRLDSEGLITTGAALSVLAPEAFAKAADVAASAPDAIVSRMQRGGFDASTRDPTMRALAAADPVHADVEGIPAQFLTGVAAITAVVVAELEAVRVPLLVVHGTADTMAAPMGSVELIERAACRDKTLRLVAGGYHALLRDLDRAAVEDLVIGWINARLPVR